MTDCREPSKEYYEQDLDKVVKATGLRAWRFMPEILKSHHCQGTGVVWQYLEPEDLYEVARCNGCTRCTSIVSSLVLFKGEGMITIFDLRGIPIFPPYNEQTEPTTCLACKQKIVFIRVNRRWESVFVEPQHIGTKFKDTGEPMMTSIHEAFCAGIIDRSIP